MSEKEIVINKMNTIINFILEHETLDVSKYSETYYQKLVLLFEKAKKSIKEFMPYIPGVLDEKSYANLLKNYQEVLALGQEAITKFLCKNVYKDNEKIRLTNIPIQNKKRDDYYELSGFLKRIIGIKNGKNNRLQKKKTYGYKTYEEVSRNLYSTDTMNAVVLYKDYLKWPDKLELDNTEYGYQEDSFYGNVLMYSLEFNLDYSDYFSLSTLLTEDYDMKKNQDRVKQEKLMSITVEDVRMICSTLKYYELREMDFGLLWKERNALLKFLMDSFDNPLLIEAAGGMDKINEAVERIDDVLRINRQKGRLV